MYLYRRRETIFERERKARARESYTMYAFPFFFFFFFFFSRHISFGQTGVRFFFSFFKSRVERDDVLLARNFDAVSKTRQSSIVFLIG
jgi:hypothetical protein